MKYIKKLAITALCISMSGVMTSFTPAQLQNTSTAYEMYVNDEQVGVIKHAAKGLSYYDNAIEDIKTKYPEDVEVISEVYFKEVNLAEDQVSGELQIASAIEEVIDIRTEAYAININGSALCHVRSLEEAERIVDAIQEPYIQEIQSTGTSQLEEVTFAEDVRFEQVQIPFDKLTSEANALGLLQQTTTDVNEYTIAEGDTLWTIASSNNMHVNDILALNPELDAEDIKPGDTLALSEQKTVLSVVTKEKVSYEEEIPFTSETKEDNTLLKGKTKTVQEGKNGVKEIQAYIIKENGREISREIIGETMVTEPVNQIIAKGTKQPPAPTPKPAPASETASAPSSSVSVDRGSARGSDIVAFAKQYLGKPYRYGTAGPNSFDCSGFTYFVYKHFGYSIPRSSRSQGGVGRSVSKSELAIGDLVLFTSPNSGGAIGHVGIYIGGGNFIHASSGSAYCVKIDTLNSGSYASRYKGARRVIN
jgi:cell wall-associated NlpC family hydrolase